MKTRALLKTTMFFALLSFLAPVSGPPRALAHCDTESGPVAVDARRALENEDFEAVAVWVGEKQHEELLSAFDQAMAVYGMGGEAKALAERYFMETAVRLHRAAEGMGYTGLKPARPLPADIAAAEKALETGSLEPVSDMLTTEIQKKLQHLFEKVRKAGRNKDKSLEAGRKWADAYVKYVTYVHGLYKSIKAGPAHGVGE